MRHIVDAIAAQGRNGDDTLIHVSKKELRMMKDIGDRIGIKSTTNPHTGLPEAFNWLGTLGGIAGGIAGTFVTPGAGTAAGAALGSGLGTAAGGGTLKQSLTTGLISGVTAYAGGAALGSMSEAGAGLGGEVASGGIPPVDASAAAVQPPPVDAGGAALNTVNPPAGTPGTTPNVDVNPTNTGTTPNVEPQAPTNAPQTPNVEPQAPNVEPQVPKVEPQAPTNEPQAPNKDVAPQDSGIRGNGLRMESKVGLQPESSVGPKVPEGGGIKPNFTSTKPEFSMENVKNYWNNTPTKDIVKQYGADIGKTVIGQGMAGMMPVGGVSQPAPIEIPGKKQMAKPDVELYQGPEGELRTRVKAAQGGLMGFADYDAADAQSDGGYSPGGPIGYATGGSAGTAGGIATIASPTTAGNQTAKTGNVLPAGFFSKEEYTKATPAQRATMDRLMAAQREMSPSPMRRQNYNGGGIAAVRALQPGGQWGDMTASMYGAVQEQKPQWLQNIEPGGFIGATVPGKMDYEDKKRAEEEAKKAEEKAKEDAVKAQLKQQEDDRLNKIRGGSEIQQPQTAASGGLMGFARGRYLQGPGDGMSDSIPANIDGRQEARLATGEFVIPADVVSHLGNGDSSAGAKQLHSMMDRARMARTGTKKQGKQINPKKVMPV